MEKLEAPAGLIARDALAVVDGGSLYYNGYPTPITGMKEGEKQLVSMGAYICIFPDKLYYNTQDPSDYGSMEAYFDYEGQLEYIMCDIEGKEYPQASFGNLAPESAVNGDFWVDTENGSLNQFDAGSSMWVTIDSVYTKLRFTTLGQLPAAFSKFDGVEIEGAAFASLNGAKIIQAVGGSETEPDYIVLAGEPAENRTESEARLSIKRTVPDMDYVCQCHNRLWGCFYGNNGKENLNELYASALGDFKNWNQFMGLSTDSWRASVGSDGVWTGAVSFLGSPIFFKEDRIHSIGVSSVGAHQVGERVCPGVQRGSHKSLAVVNEVLFYKAPSHVCAYQGGFPEKISAPLGDERYHDAVACGLGGKYYISMCDAKGESNLFVYDCEKGIWMREDGLKADFFATVDEELYCISGKDMYAMLGSRGEREKHVDWQCESGLLSCSEPDKKYISRISLRAAMEQGSRLELFIEYDSAGTWERAGQVQLLKAGTAQLPLRLRRCDHFRLKLCGRGDIKLLSLTREECRG